MARRRTFVNPFEIQGRWYKANLHTHTTHSDGRLTPTDRAKQYAAAGYHVLALTDHGRLADAATLADDSGTLLIGGLEFHPKCPNHPISYHLVALNVPAGFRFDKLTPNGFIRKVRAAGGEVVLAHPFWCGFQLENFRSLKGLAALEVYNETCDRSGRAGSENEWAHALDRGLALPAIAVDDCHAETADAFGGWTMLKMPSLTAGHVMRALRTGAFYASCGPEIHDFRLEGQNVCVRCSPAAEIHVISSAALGALCRAQPGKTVESFTAQCTHDWFGRRLPYVRARVTDTVGRMAWTNPIYL